MELNKFIDVSMALETAKQNIIQINHENICQYSLKCLNDFLFGILPNQLIVIGADTGIGKTQLANDIAITNAKKKRKVYLISLEGDKDEVINRWRWKRICEEYYKNPYGKKMAYSLFVTNQIIGINDFEEMADKEISELNGFLKIFDRTVDFNIDILLQQMELIKDDAQLVVIDHLHYFSMFDEESEAIQISKIMKTIKNLTEEYKIPIILISHLRKKERGRGMPDNEDFMGSSNIPKVASTVITIASMPKLHQDNKYATCIRVTKDRNGMKPDLGFMVMFDIRNNSYDDSYKLVRISPTNEVFVLEESQYPNWAKDRMEIKEIIKNIYND